MRTILAVLVAVIPAIAASAAPLRHGATRVEAPAMMRRVAPVADPARRPASETIACDAISDTPKTGCAVLEGMIADARRAARIDRLAKRWSGSQRARLGALLAAEATFARAVGANETDHSASEAGPDAVAATQAENAAFAHTLDKIAADSCSARNPTGRLSFVAFGDADGALNATYAQVMAIDDTSDLAWGSVDTAGIRRTQRAWLAYRDAFVAFAVALGCDADAVKSELTQRRAVGLEGFLAD